ncbi:MAG: serine acetyltransferase [Bacteroidetes bacterium]|nr:serine acetyltransferase [Bacteroidota bacterium]
MKELENRTKLHCVSTRNSPGIFATKVFNYLFVEEPESNEFPDSFIIKLAELIDALPSDDDNLLCFLPAKFRIEIWKIKDILLTDLDAFMAGDPAVHTHDEVILAYPGFYTLALHRIAHFFYIEGAWLFARLIAEYAHRETGIDIHPGAQIESGFFIDHGTGIVIGETSIIGRNVKIFQGVTLGALSVEKWRRGTKRHPTVEENVVLYAGCTILGGNTVIGHSSVIGGNVWLTQSVKPYSTVVNQSKVTIMQREFDENYFDFVI